MSLFDSETLISIHVTKTGGTTFADVLQAKCGDRLALYYGPNTAATHPIFKRHGALPNGRVNASAPVLSELREAGVKVIHGHFAARDWRPLIPDPHSYMIWLRDPVERTVSLYFYLKGLAARGQSEFIPDGQTLEEFVQRPACRNEQTRLIWPFAVEGMGFVGLTGQFGEGLSSLGLRHVPARRVNADKPTVPAATLALIEEMNEQDVALYRRAAGRWG